MFKSRFAAALGATLITLAGGLFGADEAQARAIYTGTFDPRGPVYGFSGDYKFAVDPECLKTNGWKAVNVAGAGDCGDVFLVGGSLTLRKYATSGTDENAPRADGVPDVTFNFTQAQDDWDAGLVWGPEPGQVGGMQDYIDSIYVVNNQLYGVDTPALFGAFGLFDNRYWGLEFVSGGQDGQERSVKLLANCDPKFTPTNANCSTVTDTNSPFYIPAALNVTITLVPEPGSLALVAGALMAVGVATRRTRRS